MKKCDLKKLALLGVAGGFLLNAQSANADERRDNDGNYETMLAKHGCGSGCGGSKSSSRYMPNNSCSSPSPQYGYYESSSCNSHQPPQGYIADDSRQGYYYESPSSYDQSNPNYNQDNTRGSWDNRQRQQSYYQDSQKQGMQRQQGSTTDDSTLPPMPNSMMQSNPQGYMQTSNSYYTTTGTDSDMVTVTVTETELLTQLTPQNKATYQSLSPEGKKLALQFASQKYKNDKNKAVQEAAKKINEKTSSSGSTSRY